MQYSEGIAVIAFLTSRILDILVDYQRCDLRPDANFKYGTWFLFRNIQGFFIRALETSCFVGQDLTIELTLTS